MQGKETHIYMLLIIQSYILQNLTINMKASQSHGKRGLQGNLIGMLYLVTKNSPGSSCPETYQNLLLLQLFCSLIYYDLRKYFPWKIQEVGKDIQEQISTEP